MRVPPKEHGEHEMEITTSKAIYRQQWRQSLVQEEAIRD